MPKSSSASGVVLVLLGVLGIAGGLKAEKITVVYTATVGALGDSTGADLASGSLVRFGFFDVTAEEVKTNFSDLDYLLAHFRGISETEIGLFDGEPPLIDGDPFYFDGVFANTVSFDPESTTFAGFEGGVVGARPYLWGFNAETVGEATEHGIFSSSEWFVPAIQGDFFELSTVSPVDLEDVYLGVFTEGGSQILAEENGDLHQLIAISDVAIPEPTCLAFLIVTVAGGLLRRSRSCPQ
ncbi:MAG: hypothetical protein P8J87_12680 [Verrucomicrobiales bacterium]|nr:hypothetical protein [Verrucomicrobiales bacterium]